LDIPIEKRGFRHPNDEDDRGDKETISCDWRMAAGENLAKVTLVGHVVGPVDASEFIQEMPQIVETINFEKPHLSTSVCILIRAEHMQAKIMKENMQVNRGYSHGKHYYTYNPF